MARPVDSLIVDFAEAGASHITIHPESTDHLDRSLRLIRQHHCKAGIALNPATPLSCLDYVWDEIDFVLIMSVNPGFGGQSFIASALEKIHRTKELIQQSKKTIRIAVDGGIKVDNIADVAAAGADTFIAGSAIFNQPDYAQVIRTMREKLNKVK